MFGVQYEALEILQRLTDSRLTISHATMNNNTYLTYLSAYDGEGDGNGIAVLIQHILHRDRWTDPIRWGRDGGNFCYCELHTYGIHDQLTR